ncbi:FecR domain-containing protein [Candidatus Omnitrophota bacterium]
MKKVVLIVLACFLITGLAHNSYAAKARTVTLTSMEGSVKVDVDGNDKWASATVGMKLKKDSKLRTGRASYAVLAYNDEGSNVVRVKENTNIVIGEISRKSYGVELFDGKVLARFKKLPPGSKFEVRTPTAVCGIRGSGLGVDFINGMTVVSAFESSAFVQGTDSAGNPVGMQVTIPEGWKSSVAADGTVTQPVGLSANEVAVYNAWVKVITGEAEAGPVVTKEAELPEEPATPERPEGSEYQ